MAALSAERSGGPDLLAPMLRLLGYEKRSSRLKMPQDIERRASEQAPSPGEITVAEPRTETSSDPRNWARAPFWLPVRYQRLRRLEEEFRDAPAFEAGQEVLWEGRPEIPPSFRPLTSWVSLQPRLRDHALRVAESKSPDVDLLVQRLGRGQTIRELPRRRRRRWGASLQIVVDRSRHLTPFWEDQRLVQGWVQRIFPQYARHVALKFDGLPPLSEKPHAGLEHYRLPPSGSLVLLLGDLGCLTDQAGAREQWLELGRRLIQARCRPVAITPCPPSRWLPELLQAWTMIPWERAAPAADPRQVEYLPASGADGLLCAVSPAVRIEPGLLREIRLELGSGLDASTESLAWQHPDMAGRSSSGGFLDADAARLRRQEFARLPQDLRRRLLGLMRAWRQGVAAEVWFEEINSLDKPSRSLVPSGDLRQAQDFYRSLAGARSSGLSDASAKERDPLWRGADDWIVRAMSRVSERAFFDPQTGRAVQTLWSLAERRRRDASRTISIARGSVGLETWQLWQRGAHLRAEPHQDPPIRPGESNGSLVASLELSSGYLVVGAPSDPGTFWQSGTPPFWAHDWGRDPFGVWVTFRIGEVEQKMRWIPAGTFWMGSPADEEGRFDDESPRHPVTLTSGFWLFEAPTTQALWKEVMKNNPSSLTSPDRPVEQVSWDDCQAFLAAVSERIPGLELALPSEAQWEYACRAGTTTATYKGNLEIINEKATILDEIAWYHGNSDGGTHPVKKKTANPWGLYDMLGNVYEWCQDWKGDYSKQAQVDPPGPAQGADRVVRGGSWSSVARDVRAAFRLWDGPGRRYDSLGFRCARVQAGAAPREAGRGREAEPRPQDVRPTARVLTAGRPRIELPRQDRVVVSSDLDRLEWARIVKPSWADAIGRDRCGLWVEFALDGKEAEVRQRLRWIPPGRFRMGSPEDEAGREDGEVAHQVTLTSGFWFFDTPCTQALWEAVQGNNPSYFQDAIPQRTSDRPVESVSWDQCQEFLSKLNSKVPDLRLSLPSEAQWEYACRAGTDLATCAGDLVIEGANNAPILDEIAWYGGNSGLNFELEKGVDSSGWEGKQYDHSKAGTHPVKKKLPNPWGLYDMLGNVYEWCADRHGPYGGGARADPPGPETGADRVFRGGSWFSDARDVRAAYRYWYEPGYRSDYLGFRCARVQELDQEEEEK